MRNAAAAFLALLLPTAGAAQAGRVTEVSAGAVMTTARRDFVGGAVGLGLRGRGRHRAVLTAAAGALDDAQAVRLELGVQFLLNPWARAGVTVYGGAGAAYVAARGTRGAGYLALVLGVERAAARSPGWFLEAGLGGGVRVAAGLRLRRFSGP